MTPWQWWAEVSYAGETIGFVDEYHVGPCPFREAVIAAAMREARSEGDRFQIVEARQSTAVEYEGADIVPFLCVRNEATYENRDGVAVLIEPLQSAGAA